MPKLPARTGKQIAKILVAHGFVLDHITGSHHIFVRDARRISVPIHTRDLPKGTLHEILKAADIRPEDL
ncbi:type II toxin-antitoxin system HicA family toxin [Candidatus Kaiserbacteria bacterium]|nr:type II toxin-antitoxin system HicA family toxin [Candidatus Kaiserbacteria bacterium]